MPDIISDDGDISSIAPQFGFRFFLSLPNENLNIHKKNVREANF